MRRILPRIAAAFALGLAVISLPALADDAKPAKSAPEKAPDFSGYAYVTDVVGEIVKADDKGITLRISWIGPAQKLSANSRNYRNSRPQLKQMHHDYELEYLPQSLVRSKSLPPKVDENGKKVAHTQKEIEELRQPPGAHGYAASKVDLTPGTMVEVIIVRDKTIPAAKATEDDLRLKYVTILGHDLNPPKDIGGGNAKNAKNKNNN